MPTALTRICNPEYVDTPEDIAEQKGYRRYWMRKLGMIPTPPAVALEDPCESKSSANESTGGCSS